MTRRILIGAALVLAAAAVFTGWALESSGVAVIATVDAADPNGAPRATHVWYVEHEGALWLEAGAPGNPWVRDIQSQPALSLAREGRAPERYAATIAPERSGEIRSLLRRKYGFRDRWVGLFVDASRSKAVRLEPLSAPSRRPSSAPARR